VLAVNSIVGGRYRVIKLLGGGGMKQVYLVEDLRLANRRCALAEMLDNFADADLQRRAAIAFHREAEMLAKLDNQHIPGVYDNFSEQNRHYLVMEYVEGTTLEEKLTLNGGRLTEALVTDIASQAADALEHLHGLKPPVVYRDLKPSNVMVTPAGLVKLVDFGIARNFQPLTTATAIGTQGYAAPEQYRGKAEARSDLYALGATMHHLLTGRDPAMEPPFSFPPVEQLLPKCNLLLAKLINDALAYKPEERPADAAEFRQRLVSAKMGSPLPRVPSAGRGATAQSAVTHPVALKARRRSFRWVVVGVFGLVAAEGLDLLLVSRPNPENESETPKVTFDTKMSPSVVLPTPEAASPKTRASAEDLQREARLHPDDAGGWLRLGRAWLLRAKSDDTCYPKALEAYEHALGLAPRSLEALSAVGYIDIHEKEYRKAVAAYERYFAHGGDDRGARLRLAAAYVNIRLGRKAISQCKTVLAQEPFSFDAELILGAAYNSVGNYSGAQNALQKARSLAPDEKTRAIVDKLTVDVQNRAAVLKTQKPRNANIASGPSEEPGGHTVGSSRPYFTIGSTKEQVLALQGTPRAVQNYDALGVEDWEYGPYGCQVEFSEPDGRVKSYDNSCGRLHVRLK
jgi:serine/threonine protein kinase